MVPCLPHILKVADIPQLAALVAPRPLLIEEPLWASGDPADGKDLERVWTWTRQVYRLCRAEAALGITEGATKKE